MNQTDAFPVSRLIYSFISLAFFPLILFFLAGDWRWFEGWLFSGIFVGGSFATLLYLYFNDPALLNERYGSPVPGSVMWLRADRRPTSKRRRSRLVGRPILLMRLPV